MGWEKNKRGGYIVVYTSDIIYDWTLQYYYWRQKKNASIQLSLCVALFAKRLFAGSSMAVAALVYLGKTMHYDLCPKCDSCEPIGSKFAVVVRTLRIRSVIPVQTYTVGGSGSLGESKGYMLGYRSTPWITQGRLDATLWYLLLTGAEVKGQTLSSRNVCHTESSALFSPA